MFVFTAGLLSSFFTLKKREYVFSMFEVVIIRICSTVFVVVGFFAILYYSFKNQILITMSETHTLINELKTHLKTSLFKQDFS